MTKIYTKTGDKGETGLFGGARVPKHHPKVAAYGDVDETNSFIGAALGLLPRRRRFASLSDELTRIQHDLFCAGAILATPKDKTPSVALDPQAAGRLEAQIDRMTAELEPLTQFILPGGAAPGAFLHLARAACRRAERSVTALGPEAPEAVIVYLNRLSDYLFTAARWANRALKKAETRWKGAR